MNAIRSGSSDMDALLFAITEVLLSQGNLSPREIAAALPQYTYWQVYNNLAVNCGIYFMQTERGKYAVQLEIFEVDSS